MNRLVLLLLVSLGLSVSHADEALWKSDRSHSRVGFAVSHLVISEVEGMFTEFDAVLKQGGADFAGSSVEATIKMATVTTGDERRDNHLRGDDFFNAEKFPLANFRSTTFEKVGEGKYKITGDLTIRDVTKPVVLDARLTGRIPGQAGKDRIAFKATTTINRQEFGVKWNKVLETGGVVAGDDVTVEMVFQFVK